MRHEGYNVVREGQYTSGMSLIS